MSGIIFKVSVIYMICIVTCFMDDQGESKSGKFSVIFLMYLFLVQKFLFDYKVTEQRQAGKHSNSEVRRENWESK